MAASNFVKLCTAALAGSLIGIAYERMPQMDWQSAVKTVSAAGTLVPRNDESDPQVGKFAPYKIPDVNPALSAENLKHSAKFGLPSKDNLRLFDDYIISYDRRLRSAAWVIEHMNPEKLKNKGVTDRDKSQFQEDSAIHEYFRAKAADYKKSGYDRGHLAAAGNHKLSQNSLDQTFALSNISPQEPQFNRGAWERLETYVRYRANRSKNLYCVTGPLYLPMRAKDGNLYVTYRVLGNNHISVPTHYFKVFLMETNDDKLVMEAFLMPNDPKMDKDTKINDFRVPIERLDIIERASGVIFFDQLERDKVERPLALPPDYKEGPYVPKHKRN